jgi:CRISPR-associated protein Cas5d
LADSDEESSGRTQRQTMALKDVRYRLHAEMFPWQPSVPAPKVNAEFRRRAEAGKCFAQPSFGLREFPAFFELAEENERANPISWDADLGWMLYDVFDLSRPGENHYGPSVSIFRARVTRGSMDVPQFSSADVRKAEVISR